VIAYCYAPASGKMQINVINVDGSEDRKLIDSTHGVNHADWSPNGRKIAAVVYMDPSNTTWSTHVFNADGSNPVRLTQTSGAADSEPAWSPDGTHILFTRNNFISGYQFRSSLWLMNADGSDQHRVVTDGFAGKWSPDGTRLIYSSNKTGNHELYTSSIDGTDEQRLTDTADDESYPAWSPDGKQIAFSVSTGEWNAPESLGTYEIYVMNSDGTDKRQLTDNDAYDGNPRWSPDGSLIAFSSDRAGPEHFDVYVMDADGANIRQVTHTPPGARAINPIWRPSRLPDRLTGDHHYYLEQPDGCHGGGFQHRVCA
jgi:TolB protein